MSRAFLAGLVLAMGTILAALVASAAYRAHQTGTVPLHLMALSAAALAAVLVLAALYLTQPASVPGHTSQCQSCGARVFATLRSLDRRAVFTCFACGAESLVPAGGYQQWSANRPQMPA